MKQQTGQGVKTVTRTNFFSKREMAELPNLLMEGEKVLAMISGFYAAGTALLCVTSRRILLVDKKLIRLSIEDMRFESIKEVNYSHEAFMASLQFFYVGRSQQFQFKTWYKAELRAVAQLVQHKMFEINKGVSSEYEDPVEAIEEQQVNDIPLTTIRQGQDLTRQQAELYPLSVGMEQHLNDRIAQWRRAAYFADLSASAKAGRQILELEMPKR